MKQRRQELRSRMPKAEVIVWRALRGSALGAKFRRQHSVGKYVLDFYCPEKHLAIEIDGDSHFEDGAVEYDKDRQMQIESLGLQFLRFTNEAVYTDINSVIERIQQCLTIATAPTTPNPSSGQAPTTPNPSSGRRGI